MVFLFCFVYTRICLAFVGIIITVYRRYFLL